MPDAIEKLEAERARLYATLGEVEEHRLATLVPVVPWPQGGGRWAVIRNGATTFVASDGLSDPRDGEDEPGFGVEVVMATDAPIAEVRSSWLFAVVAEISNVIADYAFGEDLRPLVEELGTLSLSLTSVRDVPNDYVAEDGTVGALLGLPSYGVPAELGVGGVRLLVVRLLKANELAEIIDGGDPARERIAAALAAQRPAHLESLTRASLSTGIAAPAPPLLDDRRAEVSAPSGDPSSLLVVSGLGRKVSEDDVRTVFGTVGEVVSVRLGMLNMVEMASADLGAQAVDALHGRFVRGQPITLAYARRRGR